MRQCLRQRPTIMWRNFGIGVADARLGLLADAKLTGGRLPDSTEAQEAAGVEQYGRQSRVVVAETRLRALV